ncbi:MAG: class I SAM-dependent methyltransferase [Devosiaceae bacterium]
MNALLNLIKADIEATGPMTVSRYMQLCLAHPQHGYYQKADPLGTEGDFTTAPEISQLFGEMIGVWLLQAWQALGKPAPFALVELGPGRGTLMADILRVLSIDPDCAKAAQVHLVETSPTLTAKQIEMLAKTGQTPVHHSDMDNLPALPTLWVANEFFDALPTNQWVRTEKGWNVRKIGLDDAGELTFGVEKTPLPAPKSVPTNLPIGTIIEHSHAQDNAIITIAKHARQYGGAGLILDYGSLVPGSGDTLQAVKAHRKADPLGEPGEADLTTHIDFVHMASQLRQAGLQTIATAGQGQFLLALGLLERAGQLGAGRPQETQNDISLAVERLAGDEGMGRLFKVLGFASIDIPMPGLSSVAKDPQEGTQ